jgi:hypothetical protein
MRANDVPNLPTGRIWIGDGNTIVSDTVYVDEPNGRVGIGTANPGFKLSIGDGLTTVDQSVYVSSGNSLTGGSSNLFLTTGSFGNAIIGMGRTQFAAQNTAGQIKYTDSLDTLSFNTNFSTKMVINSVGNVGIGTTSPTELLHISSTGPARLLIEADTDNVTETDNAQIILKQDGGAVVGSLGYKTGTNTLEITNGYAATDGTLTLGTSGAERMRIDYLGRVGIGTTVLTSISSSSSTLSLGSASASTSGGIAFQVSGGVVKAYNYVASNYLISQTVSGIGQIFYGAGSERIRIHNTTGNVGIGTTNPQSKLQVNGGIQLANDPVAASAAKVGTFRYYTSGNNSYVDMCMQTGASTYTWVNIVTNSW